MISDNLDEDLQEAFAEDLKGYAAALHEAIRDKKLGVTQSGGTRLVTSLLAADADNQALPSREELTAKVGTNRGDDLTTAFGKLFRTILPNERSREALAKEFNSLAEDVEMWGIIENDGSTALFPAHETAALEEADDWSDVSNCSEQEMHERTWNDKLEDALQSVGPARVCGQGYFQLQATKLRLSLGDSLQIQPLYTEHLKAVEAQVGNPSWFECCVTERLITAQ